MRKEIEEQMGHEEIQLENERFKTVSLHTEHLGSLPSCIIWPPLLVAGMKVGLGAKSGEMGGGSPTSASTRMGSQQGSWQQVLQGPHCRHRRKEAEQEPRIPGTAGCRVVRATAGQIHTHHHHKPVGEVPQRPLCWSLAPFPPPIKKLVSAASPCPAFLPSAERVRLLAHRLCVRGCSLLM